MELGSLDGEVLGRDLTIDPQFEECLELGLHLHPLALQFDAMQAVLILPALRLGLDDLDDPGSHIAVLDPHAVKDGLELGVDVWLRHADPWVARRGALGAEVVGVLAFRSVGTPLDLGLAGEQIATVAAGDQASRERQFGLAISLLLEPLLHRLERGPVDERLKRPGMPLFLEADVADVVAVRQDAIQDRLIELGMAVGVHHPLPSQCVDERLQRQGLVGVQLKDPLDLRGVDRIVLDDAAAVYADIAQAVLAAHWQAALDTTADPRLDVGGLLVGLVAGKDRRHAPLHPPCRRVPRRLVGEEERDACLLNEGFEFGPRLD